MLHGDRIEVYKCVLPMPPSVNALYGGGSKQQRFKSKAYKQWLLIVPCLKPINLSGVYIDYQFYFGSNRKADCQNYIKAVTDYLVAQGVIEDDCWQCVNGETLTPMGIDKTRPRVEITIYQAKG